jgi:outer membrane protein assembly factor BamB
VLVWWLFFSRVPWIERAGVVVLMAIAVVLTRRVVHASMANGAMGWLVPILSIPVLSLALVAASVGSRRRPDGARRATTAAAILIACATFALIRTGGMSGTGGSDFHWRWTPTPEEQLLASSEASLPPPPATPPSPASQPVSAAPSPQFVALVPPAPVPMPSPAPLPAVPEWPGFRGPERDGVVRGPRIATDWSETPPIELWRRAIGPGWSSFAVAGDLIYTQEQRGDDEVVSCYRLTTGEAVWAHRDAARFWESNGGAGPRGTPVVAGGRVYSLGATGILNALDASTGALFWSRHAASDTKRKIPGWGFASSPLVVGDTVVVATAGVLAAYDAGTGRPRWIGQPGGWGYSSPHLATIAGVPQIVFLNGEGAMGLSPGDGAPLWSHAWKSDGIVQPAITADGDVLIGSGSGLGVEVGVRRVAVAHGPGGWTAIERWTTNRLKPYFNDFVVHKGHAYGFDGSILAAIDLTDGARKWKGGRYGNGQMVLLADQDLLLVLTEDGNLALVAATPGEHRELARAPAIDGKTWNHPVLVGDVLLVRNGEEMAAFRLPAAGR